MENNATKYLVTDSLKALEVVSDGTISSQATVKAAEGSTTTESTLPRKEWANRHEWEGKGSLIGVSAEELGLAYAEFKTLARVAEFFGVSKKLVLVKMKAFGVPRTKRNRGEMASDAIVLLAQEGMSVPEIAKQVRLNVTTVRSIAKSRGLRIADSFHCGYKMTHNGYRSWHEPKHANADKSGYVREHILAMTRYLNRPLEVGEIVHHIDGNKLNNQIENLMLTTKAEHIRIHNPVKARWAARDLCKI